MKKMILCLILSCLCATMRADNYEDIPLNVKKEIIAYWEAEWPNNYSIQELMIKTQFEKYREVQRIKKTLTK